jgi:hypothetical protein
VALALVAYGFGCGLNGDRASQASIWTSWGEPWCKRKRLGDRAWSPACLGAIGDDLVPLLLC